MRGPDGALFLSNATGVTSSAFPLVGGLYVFDVVATGSGSVTLQRLGPDGTTQLAIAALTATGASSVLYLPPGRYTAVTTGLTAVYASIARVPEE